MKRNHAARGLEVVDDRVWRVAALQPIIVSGMADDEDIPERLSTEDALARIAERAADASVPLNLTGTILRGANLAGANLRGATLKVANLAGASLMGADLAGANLTLGNLARADLAGADLTGAILTDATMPRADLKVAILTDATMPVRF